MATPVRTNTNHHDASPLPDVLQFMQLLWALTHGLDSISKRMKFAIGITGPQRLALRVAGLRPGLSAGDLARVLHIHPSTLTGVLHRLSAQGLLARVADPNDRRRAVLRLTATGVRLNARSQGTVEAAVAQTLRDIGGRDQAATKRLLERLTLHLAPPTTPRRRRGVIRRGSPSSTRVSRAGRARR